jgi:protein-tyrosine phosphatase
MRQPREDQPGRDRLNYRFALTLLLAFAAPATLASIAPVRAEAAARFVQLDGAQNFRDVGGYRTVNGETVKHGVLYRSGTLGGLSARGQAQLAGLRPVAIVDLRTTEERSHDRNGDWLVAQPGYWAKDGGMSLGDLRKLFGDPSKLTAEIMRESMTAAYRTMYKEQTPGYRVLFARLLDGEGPVVLNCTAGKDRTGIGAALVLTALGVPYATVREDFLLSNAGVDPAKLAGTTGSPLAAFPPEVVAPLLGVEGPYLDAAFDQIRQDHGTVENFLARELGVGPDQITQLHRRMLS